MKNRVTATMTLFPHTNSRLNLGTLSHFAPRNKPIHGLELFQFAAVSPVLLTRLIHYIGATIMNQGHL